MKVLGLVDISLTDTPQTVEKKDSTKPAKPETLTASKRDMINRTQKASQGIIPSTFSQLDTLDAVLITSPDELEGPAKYCYKRLRAEIEGNA